MFDFSDSLPHSLKIPAKKLMGVHIVGDVELSHYIEGVVEMMMDATSKYAQPLTDDRLFEWHNCLFPTGRNGMEVINVGKYRIDPMEVVSGTLDREKVHYQTPAADAVSAEMKRLLVQMLFLAESSEERGAGSGGDPAAVAARRTALPYADFLP